MDKAQTIKAQADELLTKMIDGYELEVREIEGMYEVMIKTEEHAPTVIGRHGETIRALQKILEVILYKTFGEPVEMLVNVNDYREKQKERLEGIAENIAQRVMTEKRELPLRSVSAFERKLIHEYVAKNHPDLVTHSEGEGKERQLVIGPKSEEVASE